MPVALHTCGVTTDSTRHTVSLRTRLLYDSLTAHNPHALQGRAKAAQQPRTTHAVTPLEKRSAASLPGVGKCNEGSALPSPGRLFLRSSFLVTSSKTAVPNRRQSATPSVAVPVRACRLRPCPGQEPAPDRADFSNGTTRLIHPAGHRQQTLPGLRLQRSLPERDCCAVLPPDSSRTATACAA